MKKQSFWKSKRFVWQCVFVFYLAALLQITVIRAGIGPDAFSAAPHDGSTVQYIPVYNTLQQLHNGWWAFLYPTLGNLLWFLPFGFLLPRIHSSFTGQLKKVTLCGVLLSCLIESLQWIFGSGISDIDDILLNGLGTIVGFWLTAHSIK